MKNTIPEKLEAARVLHGPYASDPSYGMTGAFVMQGPKGYVLHIISSGVDSEFNWEHVSVSVERRPPNWAEMCFVKDLFWDDEECVMQLHPPKSDYVNCHPNCLHLWKPVGQDIPRPPSELVGPTNQGELT
jgi:hypothetical protein